MTVRVYFEVKKVAAVLGWSPRRARELLVSKGAFVRNGRKFMASPELLRERLPDLFDALRSWDETGERPDHVYLSVSDIAEKLGWRKQRARRWFEKEGVLLTLNGVKYTAPRILRDHFPDIYLRARGYDDDEPDQDPWA